MKIEDKQIMQYFNGSKRTAMLQIKTGGWIYAFSGCWQIIIFILRNSVEK